MRRISRRPAPDILDHLATALQIPEREHAAFRRFAGGDLVGLSVAVPVAAPFARSMRRATCPCHSHR